MMHAITNAEWVIDITKQDLVKAGGKVDEMPDLVKQLKEMHTTMDKAKEGLSKVIKLAEPHVDKAKTGFMAKLLADAKDERKAIVKSTTRLELIVDSSEDIDGNPVSVTMLRTFVPECKELMDHCLATTKSLAAEYKKVKGDDTAKAGA